MAASQGDVQQRIDNLSAAHQEMFNKQAKRAQILSEQPYPIYPRPRGASLPAEIEMLRHQVAQEAPYVKSLRAAEEVMANRSRFPGAYKEYMNPYTQEVVKRMADEANENFKTNVLPALDAKFSRLGHFGSTAHQKEVARAARDMQKDIMAQQQKALYTGYHNAAEIYGRDVANELARAEVLSKVGLASQAGREAEMGQLAKIGDYVRQHEQHKLDVLYQDFLREHHQYPWDVLSRWIAATHGMPFATTSTQMGLTPMNPVMNSAGSIGQMMAAMAPNLMGYSAVPAASARNPAFNAGDYYQKLAQSLI